MDENDIRVFKEVAKVISGYAENPEEFLKKMRASRKNEKVGKDNKKSEEEEKPKKDQNSITSTKITDEKHLESQVKSDVIDNKLEVFKELKTIDDVTAKLLFDNNINSIDDLKIVSYKDLVLIKGMKRKIAKKIKKEVEKKFKSI